MYGMNTRGLPGMLAPTYQELQVERSVMLATEPTWTFQASCASGSGSITATPFARSASMHSAIQSTCCSIDGAVLDVRLWSGTAAPIALELTSRHVPFIVVSGYGPEDIPPAMRDATYLAKPVKRLELIDVATAMFSPAVRPAGRRGPPQAKAKPS